MLLWSITVLSVISAVATGLLSGSFAGLSWLWVLPSVFFGSWLLLAVLYFLFLWAACAIVDVSKPREDDSPFYRGLMNLTLEAAIPVLQIKLETRGLEKAPKDGRFLLVCNHIHDLDPVILHRCFPNRQLAFINKREANAMFLAGKIMHMTLCQPINRENDREALKTILRCIQLLKEDKASVAVFPEGYTSMDRLLHPFRPGVFKIAQKAQVPIVVCTVQNTYKIFGNAVRLRPTQVKLHLVEVIAPEELQGVTAVQVADRVHQLMADDLGPDLVRQDAENP